MRLQAQSIHNMTSSKSLKYRLTNVLIISSLIPLILIGLVSLYTITYEMKNRVEGAIKSNLKQVRIYFENTFDNLDYVSKQLAYSETIAGKFLNYIESDDIFDKYLLSAEIKKSISIISNTNPNIGAIFYFSNIDNEVLFTNNTIRRSFNPENLILLSQDREGRYYGPSPSVISGENKNVFSIVRKMDGYRMSDYNVYVDTDSKILDEIFKPEQYSINVNHILTDYQGVIIYNSGNPEFKIGEKINANIDDKSVQLNDRYYYFNETSRQGWSIFAVIKEDEINRASNRWFLTFVAILGLSLCISLFFAFKIWQMIYKPMRSINKEIMLMSENNYSSELKSTNVIEFDELLNKFYYMRLKVQELLMEVEQKERTKSYLEVEKLMHQINPHFLHNTLNTVQWLARENGQTEIARIIALLTKLLHYNIGKEGFLVTISKEIDAVQSYIELQRIRYDGRFIVLFDIAEDVLEVEIPRFILQPLVENALYHGLNCSEGIIRVEAYRQDTKIRITVTDNGVGMDEHDIKRVLYEDYVMGKASGLGIGIRYVKNMIRMTYGKESTINIVSKPGETIFIIEIPSYMKGG